MVQDLACQANCGALTDLAVCLSVTASGAAPGTAVFESWAQQSQHHVTVTANHMPHWYAVQSDLRT